MTGPRELRTERLLLRRWRPGDLDPFAALNADPVVMAHFQSTQNREVSEAFVDRIEQEFSESGFGLWAVEVPGVADFIGFVGLHAIPFEAHFTPSVEVGWRLAAAYWHRGYASEAARASVIDGFIRAGVPEIVSMTTPGNLRSRSVMERLGMLCDPADDFDHPVMPEGHPLRRHVLYRFPPATSAALGRRP